MMRLSRTGVTVAALLAAGVVGAALPSPAFADETRDGQWYLETLDIEDAHEITRGDGARVGLITADAVDEEHPDLRDAVAESMSLDEEGAGSGPGVESAGTAMATTLAGRGHDDSAGILGIAPEAELVVADLGGGENASFSEAVKYLIEAEVDVIASNVPVQGEQAIAAIRVAKEKGIPMLGVPAMSEDAGNPGMIEVGGVDRESRPLGQDAASEITLAAPAVDIPVPAREGEGYGVDEGEQYAVAIAAGTIALVSAASDASGEAIVETVESTAEQQSRVVNPVAALQEASTENQGSSATMEGGRGGTDNLLAWGIGGAGVLALAVLVAVVRFVDRPRPSIR